MEIGPKLDCVLTPMEVKPEPEMHGGRMVVVVCDELPGPHKVEEDVGYIIDPVSEAELLFAG